MGEAYCSGGPVKPFMSESRNGRGMHDVDKVCNFYTRHLKSNELITVRFP